MNDSYITAYVDIDGNISRRNFYEHFFVVIFAGFKFFIDRLFALLGLIITMPLMIIIAILIKIDSRGSILFKQLRTGKHGRNFYIYKFRTMVQSNDVHDFSKSDEFTNVGKIIRKLSLDELPQLYSILIGKMSFIGPRPWITEYYDNMNEVQRHRTDVRPGLTGLAQVNGRNSISIFEKINYDLEYIKNYSFVQDVKILLLTVKCVLVGKGADAGKGGIKKDLELLREQKNDEAK